ncbi:hypothetical protein HHK36_005297 [Tetracentron sinense]|uniref:LisH domain-containing protein n=1 Tax=Tetracentron sinense TaxID=13715 RepID=A0A834ZQ38_TETSI|nr:hypothetical protein HHK36_005297 [Tetracentron sinense]
MVVAIAVLFLELKKQIARYMHDYFMKTNSKETAKLFMSEADVYSIPLGIDIRRCFLEEWWSKYYHLIVSGTHNDHKTKEEASIKTEQMKEIEQENHCLRSQQFEINQRLIGQLQDSMDVSEMHNGHEAKEEASIKTEPMTEIEHENHCLRTQFETNQRTVGPLQDSTCVSEMHNGHEAKEEASVQTEPMTEIEQENHCLQPQQFDVNQRTVGQWQDSLYASEMHNGHEAKEEASIKAEKMTEIEQENHCLLTQQFEMNQPTVGQLQDNISWSNQKMLIPVDAGLAEITKLHSQMQQFKMNQPMVGQFWDNNPSKYQKMPLPVDPTPYCVPKSAISSPGLHNPGNGMNIGVGSLQPEGRPLTKTKLAKDDMMVQLMETPEYQQQDQQELRQQLQEHDIKGKRKNPSSDGD